MPARHTNHALHREAPLRVPEDIEPEAHKPRSLYIPWMESEHRVEQAINSREIHRWCLPDGTLHREDGPAYARYFRDELEVECWMLNGEFGRLDGGPTALSYQPGGTRVETWLVGPLGKYYDYPSNEQSRQSLGTTTRTPCVQKSGGWTASAIASMRRQSSDLVNAVNC